MRRRQPLDLLIAAILLTAAAACYRGAANSDTSGADSTPAPNTVANTITVRTDRATYRASDPVNLTIVNGTDSKYYFNPCTRLLERETGGAWTEVREERMCTMIAHLLDARATRSESTDLGEGLQAGRYRIVLVFTEDVPANARSIRAVSAPITVSR